METLNDTPSLTQEVEALTAQLALAHAEIEKLMKTVATLEEEQKRLKAQATPPAKPPKRSLFDQFFNPDGD
jgi:hypothetical protein